MSSELEKALERRRQKREEAQSLTEQQRAAQETAEQERITRINADFERVVSPVLQRFWSENIPQELVDIFDEYAQRVFGYKDKYKEEVRPQRRLALKKTGEDGFLYEQPYPEKSSTPESFAKKQVLQILDETGWKDLELHASYYYDKTITYTQGFGSQYLFGFSVTSENPSSVHWWTGGGDRKIIGEYTRTPESLEKIANDLAEALEKRIYTFHWPPSESWPVISGSD